MSRTSDEKRPLFDLRSFGRRASPTARIRLSPDEIAAIDRTVRRAPEVMVKVLPTGNSDPKSAARHLNYIGRDGERELELDDGARVKGTHAGEQLVEDWDLDLDLHRKDQDIASVKGRSPKLVHKIVLSMPAGASSKGVLQAARVFASEEFGLKHRYALVIHTDEPHPHVHLVVKAVSERGQRLNISPATLRSWRQKFASHLRDLGIAANATDRAVRGKTRTNKSDPMYRAQRRGDSSHVRARIQSVVADMRRGALRVEPGKATLVRTRKDVEASWSTLAETLAAQGHPRLADEIWRWVSELPPPRTEREVLADSILKKASAVREGPAR